MNNKLLKSEAVYMKDYWTKNFSFPGSCSICDCWLVSRQHLLSNSSSEFLCWDSWLFNSVVGFDKLYEFLLRKINDLGQRKVHICVKLVGVWNIYNTVSNYFSRWPFYCFLLCNTRFTFWKHHSLINKPLLLETDFVVCHPCFFSCFLFVSPLSQTIFLFPSSSCLVFWGLSVCAFCCYCSFSLSSDSIPTNVVGNWPSSKRKVSQVVDGKTLKSQNNSGFLFNLSLCYIDFYLSMTRLFLNIKN